MKYTSQKKQLSLDLFRSSFNDLPKTNRWVMLADLLPWDKLEKEYNSRLNNEERGASNKPARMVLGACIVKHKLNLSDEETILMIQENPYMQYLCGLSEFTDKIIFDDSLFTTIRKRISEEELNEMTTRLLEEELRQKEEARKRAEEKSKDNGEEPPRPKPEDKDASEFTDSQGRKHKGVLKIDATCADAEVRYPVDVDIIHDGCKTLDRLIGKVCTEAGIGKPRTCYKNARHQYLELVKRKKKSGKLLKTTISMMLDYLSKDLRIISDLFAQCSQYRDLLEPHELTLLRTIFDMYSQQCQMHIEGTHQCANRIVSIF